MFEGEWKEYEVLIDLFLGGSFWCNRPVYI